MRVNGLGGLATSPDTSEDNCRARRLHSKRGGEKEVRATHVDATATRFPDVGSTPTASTILLFRRLLPERPFCR